MRNLAQPRMRPRAVDHDEIRHRLERGDRHRQAQIVGIAALGQAGALDLGQRRIVGRRQIKPFLRHEDSPVLEIAGQRLLPQVKVETPGPVPKPHQRRGDMHRHGRLARPTLLVTHDDDVHHDRLSRDLAHVLRELGPPRKSRGA